MSEGDRTLGVRAATREATRARTSVTPSELAWLLALPCALVVVAAIVVLGPPLGRLLFPPSDIAFWPTRTPTLAIRPEPTEQARFLLALGGPVLLSALVAVLRGRPVPLRPAAIAALVQASQVALAAFAVAAIVGQRSVVYDATYSGEEPFRRVYFTLPTLVVAALLTAGAVLALRREDVRARVGRLARETRAKRIAGLAAAVAFLALWLLTAINTEGSIGNANLGVLGNVSYWIGEAYAVINDRAPLVDFHAQYSQLWPYVSAGVMEVVGISLGTYVAVMVVATALSLLAVYALFRRLVRSSLPALGLFLPFVATGFFMEIGPLENRYGPSNLFSMFPMRYGGAYVLVWLTVRHVDRARPLRAPLLFLAGGLVLLNNVEFGLPAFAATIAALLWTDARPWRLRVAILARDAALGLAGALVLVSLLTLAVAGSLPKLGYLFTFSRLWGLGGVTMLPMPALGVHLAIYATFAAAIVAGMVRAARGAEQRTLTAALVWAGVFGLGAGSYFAGRSHPEVLISLFSAWALALALLTIAVVRAVRARDGGRPAVAEAAVLAGLALAVCSLAQTPAPWSQLERIAEDRPTHVLQRPEAIAFVGASDPAPGERVVLLIPMGHRVAHELDIVNVAPYASMISMPAEQQLTETIDVLREEGGTRLFAYLGQVLPEHQAAIEAAGFGRVRANDEFAEYRDER